MKKRLKAVTLHRPWGYSIAKLNKDIENRTWRCYLNEGDLLAIHNGKKWDADGADFVNAINKSELIPNPTLENDPASAIIAIARFGGNVLESSSLWFFGPVGWSLIDAIAIEPVTCSGQQGLWTVEGPILDQVRQNYQKALDQISTEGGFRA